MPNATIATDDPRLQMHSIIQRIATGPELSKSISRAEACAGMRAILDNRVDPVQAGIFLIALRMKRETDDELKGILDALREATGHVVAEVDEVVDIADPYDGYNRCLPASPFLAPLLAECGVPAISQGANAIGPKFGVTHRHVLDAAGALVDLGPVEAAERLSDPALGWSYLDQRSFCAPLHNLAELRTTIVKRQALSTVEVLTRPLHGTLPKNNRDWWQQKLRENVARDRDTDRRLQESGWTVVRVWEHEDPVEAARTIALIYQEKRSHTRRRHPERAG